MPESHKRVTKSHAGVVEQIIANIPATVEFVQHVPTYGISKEDFRTENDARDWRHRSIDGDTCRAAPGWANPFVFVAGPVCRHPADHSRAQARTI